MAARTAHLAAVEVAEIKQSPITVASETIAAQGLEGRAEDAQSPARVYGRLLSVEAAGEYLCVSPWLIRQYILDGSLVATQLPRPKTASAIRSGKRMPVGDMLRMVLLDRHDLDAFVDRHRKERR